MSRLLPLLVAPLLIAGGCGVDPYRDETAATAHLFLQDQIKSLDPAHIQDGISGICCLQVFDALYEYHYLRRPYELKPCLAAGMPEVSEDGLVHTIRLKEGVRFHDAPCFENGKGREVTAADVVFDLKRLMDARVASPGVWILEGYVEGLDAFRKASAKQPKHRTAYEEVSGLQAVDRYTLQIRLVKPYPQLHWVLAMPYTSVYPPEAVAHYGDELLNHPVGTGAFVVERYHRSQRLVLDRNPTYREDLYPEAGMPADATWGRLEDARRPLPLCDRLVFTVFKESQPQWLNFQLGFLDWTSIPKDNFDTAVDPETRALRADLEALGVRLQKTPQLEIIYEAFNMLDPVLGTPAGEKGAAIRRAMSLAFDEEWARRKLYNDRLDRVDGLLIPEFTSYDPDFVNPWKIRRGESREEALRRARQLLADVGYPSGEGIPPLYAEVLDNVTSAQFFAAFKRDMEDIGIELRANRTTWPQLLNRIDHGDAQIWGMAWVADYPDAQNFLQLFYGPNKAPGPNASNFQDDEFDRLYEQSAAMFPGPERAALYRRMQDIVVRDCAWIIKFRRVAYDLEHAWLHNYKRNSIQDKYGKYLRVEPAARRAKVDGWNVPNYRPVWIGVALCALALGLTIWGARRRVRAW